MNIDRTLHGTSFLKSSRQFKEPLCENDIIFLQKQFMNPGIYNLDTINLKSGRSVIKTILNSLNYYKNVAFVSESNVDVNFANLYEIITLQQLNSYDEIFQYFINQFDFDFIWIEESDDNLIKTIKEVIIELGFNNYLPVILYNKINYT